MSRSPHSPWFDLPNDTWRWEQGTIRFHKTFLVTFKFSTKSLHRRSLKLIQIMLKRFISCLKEITTLHHYKDQLINNVYRNYWYLLWNHSKSINKPAYTLCEKLRVTEC
jgi:hypothetical protein